MCGFSKAVVGDEEVQIFISGSSYWHSAIDIGEDSYLVKNTEGGFSPETKRALVKRLSGFSKTQLVNLIVELIENGQDG